MIDDYNEMHNVSQYQSDVVSCHHTTSAPICVVLKQTEIIFIDILT